MPFLLGLCRGRQLLRACKYTASEGRGVKDGHDRTEGTAVTSRASSAHNAFTLQGTKGSGFTSAVMITVLNFPRAQL